MYMWPHIHVRRRLKERGNVQRSTYCLPVTAWYMNLAILHFEKNTDGKTIATFIATNKLEIHPHATYMMTNVLALSHCGNENKLTLIVFKTSARPWHL